MNEATFMSDESFFEMVANELKRGDLKQGLWAKALAESNGDDGVARSRYLALRSRQLQAAARKAGLNRARKAVIPTIWRMVLICIAVFTGLSTILGLLLIPFFFFVGSADLGSEITKLLFSTLFNSAIAFLCIRGLRKRRTQDQAIVPAPK